MPTHALPQAPPAGGLHRALGLVMDELPEFLATTPDVPLSWRTWWKDRDPANRFILADGIQPDGTVVHTLSPEDYVLGSILGTLRQATNRNKGNSPDYSGGHNNAERIAQPNAVLQEIAVARHHRLPLDLEQAIWEAKRHSTKRSGADLASLNIEVRSIRDRKNGPWIKKKDVKKGRWLYVTVPLGQESYQVRILGVADTQHLWDVGTRPTAWNDATQGLWNPQTSSRQFLEANLHRCRCVKTGMQGYTGHTWHRATDLPPALCKKFIHELPDGATDCEDCATRRRRS